MMNRLHPNPKTDVNNINKGYCTTSFYIILWVASINSYTVTHQIIATLIKAPSG